MDQEDSGSIAYTRVGRLKDSGGPCGSIVTSEVVLDGGPDDVRVSGCRKEGVCNCCKGSGPKSGSGGYAEESW